MSNLCTFFYLHLLWFYRVVKNIADDILIYIFYITIAVPVPVGCQSDDECPLDKACHNTLCVDPCNCGINCNCDVINHKPLCYAPAGFSGNPEVECQKCKWFILST